MSSEINVNEVELNGIKYIRKDSVELPVLLGDYVVVRCKNAGVHAGYLESREKGVVRLKNSRRLWRWWSKFTLSGLAMTGVLKGKENECRFSCILPKLDLTECDVCEVIYCTEEAKKSINSIEEYANE